ncbi:hypothetical protein IJ670_05695 [bacterium]|nr:hypothetical protein [bacterium]
MINTILQSFKYVFSKNYKCLFLPFLISSFGVALIDLIQQIAFILVLQHSKSLPGLVIATQLVTYFLKYFIFFGTVFIVIKCLKDIIDNKETGFIKQFQLSKQYLFSKTFGAFTLISSLIFLFKYLIGHEQLTILQHLATHGKFMKYVLSGLQIFQNESGAIILMFCNFLIFQLLLGIICFIFYIYAINAQDVFHSLKKAFKFLFKKLAFIVVIFTGILIYAPYFAILYFGHLGQNGIINFLVFVFFQIVLMSIALHYNKTYPD